MKHKYLHQLTRQKVSKLDGCTHFCEDELAPKTSSIQDGIEEESAGDS